MKNLVKLREATCIEDAIIVLMSVENILASVGEYVNLSNDRLGEDLCGWGGKGIASEMFRVPTKKTLVAFLDNVASNDLSSAPKILVLLQRLLTR